MAVLLASLAMMASVATAAAPPTSNTAPLAGMVENACPAPVELSEVDRRAVQELIKPGPIDPQVIAAYLNPAAAEARTKAEAEQRARDWPNLCKYRADNLALQAAGTRPRVVFMGDSISELWRTTDPALFQGTFVNRGISGQTTTQMVARFYADVVSLHPQIVHLLGSANDIAGNTGPTTFGDWKNNITAMVQLAQANGITVVLGSLTPTNNLYWRPQPHTAQTVAMMNAWLRDYAAAHKIHFIDYYTPLAGPDGAFRHDLSNDGVHPNRAGYALMTPIMQDALAKVRP